MSVTRIDEYRGRDILEALRDLTQRAERNQLRALVFAFKTGTRRHRYGLAGEYRDDPVQALSVVTRMEYKVNQLISEQDDEPRTDFTPL
jgi:hypothetical protein